MNKDVVIETAKARELRKKNEEDCLPRRMECPVCGSTVMVSKTLAAWNAVECPACARAPAWYDWKVKNEPTRHVGWWMGVTVILTAVVIWELWFFFYSNQF